MPRTPSAERPSARPDVALRRVGSEWVLYDAAGDRAHVLNATAAAVWAFCDGGHDPAAMAESIAQDIPSAEPAAIRRDIESVLRRFAAEGLLR
ncbi:MAG: PqqD family protein [Gemmatimonadales bacterium]